MPISASSWGLRHWGSVCWHPPLRADPLTWPCPAVQGPRRPGSGKQSDRQRHSRGGGTTFNTSGTFCRRLTYPQRETLHGGRLCQKGKVRRSNSWVLDCMELFAIISANFEALGCSLLPSGTTENQTSSGKMKSHGLISFLIEIQQTRNIVSSLGVPRSDST